MKNNLLKHGAVTLMAAALLSGGLSACYDESEWEGIPNGPFLSITETSLNFDSPATTYQMTVKCNEDYAVGYGGGLDAWCTAVKDEAGDLTLNITENPDKNVRRGELYIQAVSQTDTIPVAQLGWGKAILLSVATVNVDETGGEFEVDVTANVEYNFNYDDCDWVTETAAASTRAHETVTKTHRFAVSPNKGEARNASILVDDVEASADIEGATLTVSQKGLGSYEPGTPETGNDIKITASSVTGDGGSRPNAGMENMIDGNPETYWQSNWTAPKFPYYVEFTFDEPQEMDYIIYHPSVKSHFKNVEIQVYSDVNVTRSAEYRTVWSGTMTETSGASRISFTESQAGVTKVKFIITDTYSGNEARCCEMEFYKKDPNTFDWTTLFTDPACTELKPGLTEQDILSSEHSFYKNIAWYMYNDKYPREFRIADFKAYPHPSIQAKENKTNTYSLLDNPTGISVAADETLVVMADLKGLESVNIRVQNLDTPGADGFGGDEYSVHDGINTFTMKEKGLVYVMYHTPDYETAPVIKLHFASGKVNGYFDSQNPAHEGRWNELLSASTDKYFDVLGKYAHLTFPTVKFQNNTKDGKALIDWYDQLVYREQELMGLEKYGRMFKNRMYFNVMYTSYMYSTSYRTSYNESTMDMMTNVNELDANCWGPAHEVGHSNQTTGLKWAGLTEVTNNIMSMHIQTSVCGEPSRLEEQDFYQKAWNDMVVGGKSHVLGVDVFSKLVPFWQLELYYGKALGRTPMQQSDHGGFYPDVYEYLRAHDDLPTYGAQQLEFVYICSLTAQANLLDFFEKWGFLTPVDTEVDDYGIKKIAVTQADIDALKARVEALGYAKPDVALEYITDNTVDCYKNKAGVVSGSASRSGNTVTVTGWQNVVAFEVKDASGKLIQVAEGIAPSASSREFTLTTDWADGFTVDAVSATGTRTRVSL